MGEPAVAVRARSARPWGRDGRSSTCQLRRPGPRKKSCGIGWRLALWAGRERPPKPNPDCQREGSRSTRARAAQSSAKVPVYYQGPGPGSNSGHHLARQRLPPIPGRAGMACGSSSLLHSIIPQARAGKGRRARIVCVLFLPDHGRHSLPRLAFLVNTDFLRTSFVFRSRWTAVPLFGYKNPANNDLTRRLQDWPVHSRRIFT